MTDPTDPAAPVDGMAADDASDRAWLRSHLDPIVGGEPPDGWAAIAQRVDGREAPAPRRGNRTLRLVAAGIAVLLLAGTAVVVARGQDEGSTKVQMAPPQPTAEPEPTGWYAPVGLPAGWKVLQVLATPGGKVCEARGATWTNPGKAAVGITYDTCAFPQNKNTREGFETRELTGGITATGPHMDFQDPDDPRTELRWDDDGGGWLVQANGVTPDQVVEIANALIASPDRDDLPVPGLDLLERWDRPETAHAPNVVALLQAPSGKQADLALSLPGHGRTPDGGLFVTPVEVSGQPLDVVRFTEPDPDDGWSAERYRGRWPGADLSISRHVPSGQNTEDAITDQDLEILIGALRPQTTEEWRAFLDTSKEVTSGLSAAETLAQAGSVPLGEMVANTTTTAPATTTSTAPATTTTAPTEPGALESQPATVTAPTDGQPRGNYSDLTGLRVRLRLASAAIGSSEGTNGALIIENTTDHTIVINECSSLLTRWGLLPRGEPGVLPIRRIIDCYDTPTTTIAANDTTIVPLEWGQDSGFIARSPDLEDSLSPFLGTLPGGEYDAIAVIPGSTGDIRVEIPVRLASPRCPMSDDEATRYRNLSYDQASAAAARDGRHLAIGSVDGEVRGTEWNSDCSRVRVDLANDEVFDYTFG